MISPGFAFGQHQYFLIHYKNCMFHGQTYNSLKQNVGILLLDNGQVLIGNFKNDQLNGDCISFLNPETYVIGSYSRGMLDGTFVLRNPKITVYWTAKMNKIQGEILVINYESMIARNWIIQNGQGHCTNQIQINQTDKEVQIIEKLSPYTQPYGLSVQFLYDRFSKYLNIQSSSLTHTFQVSLSTNSLYKLKVVLFKDKLIQYGVYHGNQLNGLGYLLEGMNVLQGRFKNGKLDGYGLKIQSQMERIIYGSFKNGDIRSIDILTDNQQVARKQLKNYKRQQHIYSLDYCNNYFNERPILMLANFLKTIEQNDMNFTRQLQYQEQLSSRQVKQKVIQKQRDQLLSSDKLSSTYRKQRISERQKESESGIKAQIFQSRFKKSNNTNYLDSTKSDKINKTSDFSEGINEYNRINKALRKFK